MDVLHAPAVATKSSASQSSNSGCEGLASVKAEIARRRHDALAEVVLPEPIDHAPGAVSGWCGSVIHSTRRGGVPAPARCRPVSAASRTRTGAAGATTSRCCATSPRCNRCVGSGVVNWPAYTISGSSNVRSRRSRPGAAGRQAACTPPAPSRRDRRTAPPCCRTAGGRRTRPRSATNPACRHLDAVAGRQTVGEAPFTVAAPDDRSMTAGSFNSICTQPRPTSLRSSSGCCRIGRR